MDFWVFIRLRLTASFVAVMITTDTKCKLLTIGYIVVVLMRTGCFFWQKWVIKWYIVLELNVMYRTVWTCDILGEDPPHGAHVGLIRVWPSSTPACPIHTKWKHEWIVGRTMPGWEPAKSSQHFTHHKFETHFVVLVLEQQVKHDQPRPTISGNALEHCFEYHCKN